MRTACSTLSLTSFIGYTTIYCLCCLVNVNFVKGVKFTHMCCVCAEQITEECGNKQNTMPKWLISLLFSYLAYVYKNTGMVILVLKIVISCVKVLFVNFCCQSWTEKQVAVYDKHLSIYIYIFIFINLLSICIWMKYIYTYISMTIVCGRIRVLSPFLNCADAP